MGIPWGIPEIQWFCLKQPILSILSIFQLLKNLKKQILLQTTVNMCETGHNNLTHHCWAKNCMGIPWGIPEKQWFCFKQLKTAYFKHFEQFPEIEIYKKNKVCCKPLWICVKLVTITWLSPVLSKKLHGNTLRHTWETVILLKTALKSLF